MAAIPVGLLLIIAGLVLAWYAATEDQNRR